MGYFDPVYPVPLFHFQKFKCPPFWTKFTLVVLFGAKFCCPNWGKFLLKYMGGVKRKRRIKKVKSKEGWEWSDESKYFLPFPKMMYVVLFGSICQIPK